MKNITSDYKTNVKEFGRQIDSKISYVQDGVTIELGKEQLNSVTPHYESQILKSTMKQLDIDSNIEIPLNTVLNYRFGVKTRSGKNLLDLENKIVGYGFDNTNNIIVTSSTHDIYYIPVEAGKTYVSSAVLGTSSGNIAYAYSTEIPQENTPVTGRTTTDISILNNGTFTAPTGAKYLLIRLVRESQILTKWQIEEGTQPTPYEEFGEYEYINYGNYVVYSSEKQEDTNSYKIVCYDKMLYSMKDYTTMNITYPITIRSYLQAICDTLGLTFKNTEDTFTNYDKEIPNELYFDADGKSLGYKFRDVLDELAQVTGSTICINEDDDSLEIRYINDLIDETTEVEGNSITITDNEEEQPLDIQLKGNTTQDSTTMGKNLLNPAKYIHAVSGATVGNTGTLTAYNNSFTTWIEIENNATYAFSGDLSSVNSNVVRTFVTNDEVKIGATVKRLANLTTSNNTFTNSENYKYVVLEFLDVSSYNESYKWQLEKNDHATSYEPFVPNSPSPDYPQPINNVTGEQVVEITGKNLYDPSYRRLNGTIFVNNGTGTESDGTFILTATGSDMFMWHVCASGNKYDESRGQLYEFKENSYTVSVSNSDIKKNYVTYYDKNGVSLGYTQKASTTFSFNKSDKTGAKYFSLRFGYGQSVSGTSYSFTVQLEKETVSSPVYEPYIGHTYPINLGKNLFDKDNANVLNRFINNSTHKIGTSTDTRLIYIKCKPNTTYTVSKMLSARFMIGFTDAVPATSMDVYGLVADNAKTQLTSTSGQQSQYLVAFIYHANYDTTITLDDILDTLQIEENPYATSYSAYKTPIELCKTEDGQYQDTIKKSDGKNLFEPTLTADGTNITQQRCTVTINNDEFTFVASGTDIYFGNVGSSGTSYNKIYGILMEVKNATKVYFKSTNSNFNTNFIQFYDTDKIILGRTQIGSSGNANVPNNAKYCSVRIGRNDATSGTTYKTRIIVSTSEIVEYEPYGKVWYKECKIGKYIYDGTGSVNNPATNYYNIGGLTIGDFINTIGTSYYLCSHYQIMPVYNTDSDFRNNTTNMDFAMDLHPSKTGIRFKDIRGLSNNDFKASLTGMNVYFALANPTYEIITDTELIGQLENIRLLTGLNNISLSSDGTLKLKYINEYETIDEYYLKDVNVNFGEKYGPVNSIVLSRSAGADNIYLRDEESVTLNGLCEIKIADNQIMNGNNRDEYLQGLLNRLDGLNYYLNDYTSTGITFYEICDRYRVKIGDIKYPCVMFNDETLVTQGLQENIHTDMPEESETPYSKADKTDRRLNQTTLIVDKQNQQIQSVVTQIGDRSQKQTTITQDIDSIESQIQDIPTITTESEGIGQRTLINLAKTKLAELRVHPTETDIIGLFASPLLKASTTLKTLSMGVTFDGDIDTYYKIPDNLYFYDEETYDEFVYDGLEEKIYIVKKVDVDGQGNKSVLQEPVTVEYEYEDIMINEGDYNIFMATYPDAYIYVKAMIKNDYTDTFATKLELESSITQTATSIMSRVNKKVDSKEFSTAIKQTAHSIALTATDNQTSAGLNIKLYNEDGTELDSKDANITMTGLVKFTDLSGTGTTTINGSNITTGTLSADRVSGGTLQGTTITGNTISGNTISGGSITGTTISGNNISGGTINGSAISGSDITLTSSDRTNFKLQIHDNADENIIMQSSAQWLRLITGEVIKVQLGSHLTTGFVGVNDTSGNSCTMTSSGVNTSSDIRYKENIKKISEKESLKLITSLNPINYTFKDNKDYHRGLSAQEVEKTMIENNLNNQIYKIDEEGKYSLNYTELIPDLINCIKYLSNKIKELENEK